MILHPLAGRRQNAHRSVGLGGRSMTAGRPGPELGIQHTLLRNADKAAGLRNAGEHILHHSAALVHNHSRLHMMVDKIPNDVLGTHAVDLFTAGEGEIDVIFRTEPLGDEVIGSGENAVEGGLGVQGATAPEDTVLQDARKGRLLPALLVHRHHIVVGHQHRRVPVVPAGPPQQQRPVRQLPDRTDIKHSGIQRGQQGDQLLELPVLFQGRIVVGNGFAPHQLGQGIHCRILVKIVAVASEGRLLLGGETGRPHCDHRSKGRQSHEDQDSDHITAPLSCTGSGPRRW